MSKTESSESPPPPPKADHHDAGEKAPAPPPKVDRQEKAPPPPDDLSSSSSTSDDECSSVSSSPSYKSSKKPPKPEPTQPPPNQEMERSPSAYRIPPSVFERNKSSAAGDWSAASNDSLFSIHVGNMSFTNDQYMYRSEELTPPPPGGDHMFSYPAHSSNGGVADMRSCELGLAEATMLEVIKENEGRSPPVPVPAEVRKARRSAGSNQSNMSFAFSTAGGDTERIPSSIKSPENTPVEPQQHDEPIEKGAQPARSKWLSCCSCWPFRS
ncbi:hepatoma-derived growth factor-related protein 2-like [Salvia splendens]|uniref:hepatoma-derived growth factor-related protein 2-like n=1 Tax=Salvia splendens TaxID=180675 RepID=UPI001C263E07|nr:hepatoma-derived growth factor-related protein 2-like [Salvia splendens]XP_042016716.1 hepatoma-derived growth factor-related protein 2-like [Salvia splendens]XP_042016717.1 hepatoma-derived growth factor-related protein 2-like [Salvia splendens]